MKIGDWIGYFIHYGAVYVQVQALKAFLNFVLALTLIQDVELVFIVFFCVLFFFSVMLSRIMIGSTGNTVVMIINLLNFRDPIILFSGGTCSSKKKGLTLMQGSRSVRVLCTDTVVDFVCITSTPWGEGQ